MDNNSIKVSHLNEGNQDVKQLLDLKDQQQVYEDSLEGPNGNNTNEINTFAEGLYMSKLKKIVSNNERTNTAVSVEN